MMEKWKGVEKNKHNASNEKRRRGHSLRAMSFTPPKEMEEEFRRLKMEEGGYYMTAKFVHTFSSERKKGKTAGRGNWRGN